jgi:protein-S-isoprenylcysteine O-methyltransferase Ste14
VWLTGAAIILRCFTDFTFTGHGTPNPADPPKTLVTSGLYRYVRNPIYVGVLAITIGHFLWFRTIWMLIYALGLFLIFHLFFTLYEEPTLRKKFGAAYEQYCTSVPRWIPKLK